MNQGEGLVDVVGGEMYEDVGGIWWLTRRMKDGLRISWRRSLEAAAQRTRTRGSSESAMISRMRSAGSVRAIGVSCADAFSRGRFEEAMVTVRG